jgi:hypothetical protein
MGSTDIDPRRGFNSCRYPTGVFSDGRFIQLTEANEALVDDIAGFTHDPLGFARYAFAWGEGELSSSTGPRTWQAGVLGDIGSHLQNPATRYQPCQIAVASGHGIGKSALIGTVIAWAESTCEDCRVVLTANTDTQLRTKTWPEVSKWFQAGNQCSLVDGECNVDCEQGEGS